MSNETLPEVQIGKHHCYAIAWDIIRMPVEDTVAASRIRVKYKRDVAEYTRSRGYFIKMISHEFKQGMVEQLYTLEKEGVAFGSYTTYQKCCLKIVELDLTATSE